MERYYTLRQDTKTYTYKDFYNEVKEVVALVGEFYPEIKTYRYKATISNRMTRTLGQCHIYGVKYFEIKINSKYLKSASPEHVHQTIFHEICHCIPECFNHGPKWKEAARKISKEYNIELITRTTNDENYHKYMKENHNKEYKYRIVCSTCNAKWLYKTHSKVVKLCESNNAKCPYCKDKNFKVIKL